MRRGLSISEYGIAEVETGEVHSFANEEDVYALPRLRVDPAGAARERRRARRGAQRRAAEARRARATCAATCTRTRPGRTARTRSTRWSRRAVEKGYEYYAICDHSQRLRDERLEQQHAAIDALERAGAAHDPQGDRGEHPRQRRARRRRRDPRRARLGGRVGAQLASTRTRPSACSAAMENPYVDCIGHVTNRKIGKRPPSEVDVERVIEKALETGTFLEIDSQPDRLDLTDVHARAAREAGLKLVDRLRRAPGLGARLRRARRRPGAAGVAHEGRRRQHAHARAAAEAAEEAVMTFRDDLDDGVRLRRVVPRHGRRAAGRAADAAGRRARGAARRRRRSRPSRSRTCCATSRS